MNEITLSEKYERNGWPSLDRPDLQPPDGWSLELINSLNLIHHHALSPDGKHIAFIWERDDRSDVFVMPAAGGWPRRLSPKRAKTIYWWDSAPAWSSDSEWLAFGMDGHVYVVPISGAALPQRISDFATGASSPVWLPDNRQIIVSVERNDGYMLLLSDREGSWPRQLAGGAGDNGSAAPSPDGAMVAYVFRPFDDLNRWELRLVELTNGETRHLGGQPNTKDWAPAWSPDGQQIAFLSQRSGFTEIWLVRPDGEGMHQLTHLNQDVAELSWSPDGNTIAATVFREGAIDLILVDPSSGDTSDLRSGHGIYGGLEWMPDGKALVVAYEDTTQPPDIFHIAVPGGAPTQLTFSQPPALAAKSLVIPEHFTYQSYDGLEIPALLWRPSKPNGAAIVRPHGGPTDQYAFVWDPLAQYLLAKGYTFLTPNFRGSTGYGVAFEHANYDNWGVGDTQDVLYGARYLQSLPEIDPERIGIFGSSYGGYMVACCLAKDPEYLFACGVSKYGDANLYSSWAQCERTTRLYTEMMMGHPRSNWPAYIAGSPIWDVANIQKPVLLLHGLDDDVVPPESSEEWAEAMRRHGKIFEYKTYAGEPHGFLRYETEMDWQRRTERFFDWYLRV